MDDNWNVKVADFGLSHIKKHGERGLRGSYGAIGTPLWMAPEVLQNKPYDESADVYSFGIVLWELLTQEDPFPEIESFSAMIDTVVGDQRRPDIPEKCPAKLKGLIEVCWSPDASARPTFAEIIPQFNEIIVDGIITDEMGRKMWKKYFLKDKLRDVVSWRNFVIGLTNIFKQRMPKDPDDTRWKCLKALVCDAKEKVTIEQFSMILDWFGPMQDLDSFLDAIEDLLKKTCVLSLPLSASLFLCLSSLSVVSLMFLSPSVAHHFPSHALSLTTLASICADHGTDGSMATFPPRRLSSGWRTRRRAHSSSGSARETPGATPSRR